MRFHAVVALAALAVAAGCKTKEMSSTPFYEGDEGIYTGRAEDRVNLWPLAYWREPACSVAWPIVSFSDDHFALRPLYSQYRQGGRGAPYDEYNTLWPLCQADFADGDYRAFPFFWGEGYFAFFPLALLKVDTTIVFPLMMNGSCSEGCLFPLVWWTRERGERAFTLFPLYSYSWTPERMRLWGACGLFGNHRPDTGEHAHWILPFYYANRTGLYSVPWSRVESFDGDVVDAYVCGLGGRTTSGGAYRSSWAAPFYYHDEEKLITPLFGKSADSDWVMPLYYRDGHSFFTLPYASWDNPETETRGFLSAPLLTWATWSTNSCRSSWGTLGGLVSANSNATGERHGSWAFPLYYGDAGKSFVSLPYGWIGGGTPQTNTWWATPLVGTRSGDRTGWWAFPLCDIWKDADFDGLYTLPKEGMLSGDIAAGSRFRAEDRMDILLTCYSKVASGWRGYGVESNRFEVASSRQFGTLILSGWETTRRVKYDMATRKKLSDAEKSEASLMWMLYTYGRDADVLSGRHVKRHNVLWKLWDWEERDGDVRLDAFPGFAYDAKSDGYVKASLLWRLFRYERSPVADAAVDVLFIPVWR